MKRTSLYPFLIGLILYVISVFCASLSYQDLSDQLFTLSVSAALVLIGFLTVMVLVYRKPDFMKQIHRAIQLQLSFWGCFVVDSLIGITRFFVPVDSENYAWGLLFLGCWMALSAFSVCTILGAWIIRIISKIRSK